MNSPEPMTRAEEHEYYALPENQEPQGPPRRRRSKLTELVPVRFPPETLEEILERIFSSLMIPTLIVWAVPSIPRIFILIHPYPRSFQAGITYYAKK